MREIKFRAKRIDDGRWVYGQYFKTPLTDENSGTKPEDGWFFLCGEERHCIVQDNVSFVIDINTLGQYTVLKDKNGKEIYEGDVLSDDRYSNIYDQVKFKDGRFICIDGYSLYNCLAEFQLEVIGNVYENPELLGA